MKKSVFVSNIPGGTKKSELYQLFQRYGMVLSIELRTRGGRNIVGRQPQYPFETGPYLCSTIEFDSPESAKNACEVKTESTYSAKPIMNPSLLGKFLVATAVGVDCAKNLFGSVSSQNRDGKLCVR